VPRLTRSTQSTITRIAPCTAAKSRWKMPSTTIRPSPGIENTVSVTTAPPSSAPVCRPTTVTIGLKALRKPCRSTTRCSGSPLARAVRTWSCDITWGMAVRVWRITSAAIAAPIVIEGRIMSCRLRNGSARNGA